MLLSMNYDRSLLDVGSGQRSSMIDAKPPPSPMHGMGIDSGLSNNLSGLDKGFGQNVGLDDQFNKENSGVNYSSGVSGAGSSVTDNLEDGDGGDPPAVVIYMVDPFSFGIDNCDLMRLSSLALLRCFQQIIPSLPDGLRNNIFLQTISLESIFELSESPTRETAPKALRGLAFSVYSQARKPLIYGKDCKTLTGFGPASNAKRFFKVNEAKTNLVRYLNQPPFVLAPPPVKKRLADNSDVSTSSTTSSSTTDRSSNTLYINYCLNEDQRWLLATCSDERGELMQYNVINVKYPTRRGEKRHPLGELA